MVRCSGGYCAGRKIKKETDILMTRQKKKYKESFGLLWNIYTEILIVILFW